MKDTGHVRSKGSDVAPGKKKTTKLNDTDRNNYPDHSRSDIITQYGNISDLDV